MAVYDIILPLHSIVRWIVVGLAALSALKFLVGWLRGVPFEAMDRGLMAGFAGAVDLNVALGLVLIVWLGIRESAWPMHRLEHAFTMLVAAAVVHATAKWRQRGGDVTKHRNSFLAVLLTTLIIVAGVFVVNGWS